MTASPASYGINNDPNSGHREFHNRALLPLVVISLFFSYISIMLRMRTRHHFLNGLGWDDYIIIVAAVFFSVYCSTVLALFSLADGARRLEDVPPKRIGIVASLFLVTECFFILSMVTLKLSLAIFFLRILTIPRQRWTILITITLSTVFGIVSLFFTVFQCGYFSRITVFIDSIILDKCSSKAFGLGILYTYSSIATVSDWACLLVPILVLRESNMPTRSKIVVGGLMIFASLGSVTSVVRLFYLHTISYPTGDFFVNASKLPILCTIEPGVGITVASLATVRPLFTSLVEKSRRPWTTRHTSPHGIPSGGNTCTHAASSHIYTGNGALGTSSDTTVVTLSPMYPTSGPFSKHDSQVGKEEKIEDIEAEMRAYGMSDLIKPTILDEGEFDHYPPEVRRAKETERKMRWFRSPRTAPHAFLRDSKEYMLRTGTPPRPHSQILSDRSQRISGSVEEWRNGFMSHRHGSGDCSTCHSLHQGLGEPQERARYSDI